MRAHDTTGGRVMFESPFMMVGNHHICLKLGEGDGGFFGRLCKTDGKNAGLIYLARQMS
jgi:hypothetical protein